MKSATIVLLYTDEEFSDARDKALQNLSWHGLEHGE